MPDARSLSKNAATLPTSSIVTLRLSGEALAEIAGAVKTLAASGIKDFSRLLAISASASPLKRNVTIEEVGNVAAFLLSDLASGMTGQITYVDCGVSQTAVAVVETAQS